MHIHFNRKTIIVSACILLGGAVIGGYAVTRCSNKEDIYYVCPYTGRTPLLEAIEEGNEDEAIRLIEAGSDIHHIDSWGSNALCRATSKGLIRVVRKLISEGADVNSCTYLIGYTPLHEAAELGNKELIVLLLQNGANPKVRCDDVNPSWRGEDGGNETPADVALRCHHPEAYQILKQAESTCEPPQDDGM